MIDPVWEAISQLEGQGMRVMALKCDGALPNCRLWKMLSTGNGLVYKVCNNFASDNKRFLYFISDPFHLLKTVRICW